MLGKNRNAPSRTGAHAPLAWFPINRAKYLLCYPLSLLNLYGVLAFLY